MSKSTKRGFAGMDPEQQRAIARLGGITAHQMGKGHQFTAEEASEAAKKALNRHRWTPAEAAIAGRKGGLALRRKRLAMQACNANTAPVEGEQTPE